MIKFKSVIWGGYKPYGWIVKVSWFLCLISISLNVSSNNFGNQFADSKYIYYNKEK